MYSIQNYNEKKKKNKKQRFITYTNEHIHI